MKKYLVYEPMNHEFTECETLAKAHEVAEDLFSDICSDGVPDEYLEGGLQILKLLEVSHCPVIVKREDYREGCRYRGQCLYDDKDCDKCWNKDYDSEVGFEMLPVENEFDAQSEV